MRWLGDRESENVEDQRGGGGGGLPIRVGGGVGGIVVVLVALYFGVDPNMLLALLNGDQAPQQTQTQARPGDPGAAGGGSGSSRPPDAGHADGMRQFVSVVLADTEDVWRQTFQGMGKTYTDPKLVLYSNTVPSPCGLASAASGPFYCPNDQKVYLDRSFFDAMKIRLNSPGEFAEAYVIAHEIGHHVQNQLGILQRANTERARSDERKSNAISVQIELQADCLAGVWAYHADRTKHIIEKGDVEAALNAASAVGDDHLQRQSQGTVMPDAFTHGTSAQRVRWFKRGLESGSIKTCDTFAADQL
jgi:predicted metalloprotease